MLAFQIMGQTPYLIISEGTWISVSIYDIGHKEQKTQGKVV